MRTLLRVLITCLCLITLIPVQGARGQAPLPTTTDPEPPACPGGYAPTFEVNGQVRHPTTYDVSAVLAQRPTTVEDAFVAGTGIDRGRFTGVLLWQLLQDAEVITNPDQRNDLVRKSVLITGSDCYEALYAMGELVPTLGGAHQIIVAFMRDQELLGDTEGMARIINPGDKAGARRVFNIMRIRVLDPKTD